MTLHRFFLPPGSFAGDRVAFPADVSRQITRVLRLGSGDQVMALDGTGLEFLVRLDSVGSAAFGSIISRALNQAEPGINLVLYIGILKAAKLEMVLQKCTEVGVSRFVPVQTARSVPSEPGAARRLRFEAIVREAAEQSRRGRIPEISDTLDFTVAVRIAVSAGPAVLLWEEEQAFGFGTLLPLLRLSTVGLFVGPEGGFTVNETALARDAGAKVLTLGPRILRAETAAIVGSALVLAKSGELG